MSRGRVRLRALLLLTVVLAAGGAPAIATAAPESTGVTLRSTAQVETVRGAARTFGVPDGGFVSAFAFGAVVRHGADGRVLWSRDSSSLYRDWKLQWQIPSTVEAPQQAWGSAPGNPTLLAGLRAGLVDNVHPDAVGDLNGDGVPDVAVADMVGKDIASASNCQLCLWPFNVPGSSLHIGTFVTVLDGRTGRTLYSELDPGYVTQLAAVGGRLLVGDETGDPSPQKANTIGQWDSVTTVHALSLTRNGSARTDWMFSTHAKWARLLGLVDAGHGQVALAWTDTPTGLGVPGPPDGHLLMLDANSGNVHWAHRTAGYPVLLADDAQRDELVAVTVTDPTVRTEYTVSALRRVNGATVASSNRAKAVPLSLDVADGSGWAVGSVDVDFSDPDGPEAGRVSMIDPATARERWSKTLPGQGADAPASAGGVVIAGGTVFAASWLTGELPSITMPRTQTDSMTALSSANGAIRWQQAGDTGDPMSLSLAPHGTARAITDNEVVRTYTASGATEAPVAEQGDILATTTVGTDLIAGDESGAVYAYAGRALTAGTAQLRWQALLPGPVHDVHATQVDGRPVVVAAATDAVGVVDASNGRVRTVIPMPGQFVWTATVGSAGAQPAVFVPSGRTLAAYSLRTGARLWQYTAPAGVTFSNAALADGVVVAQYADSPEPGTPATHMAAIGLSAASGAPVWTVPADPATTSRAALWNGVVAGPDIPGASGHGVALAWETADGDGRIDVRDARTGALDYADTDGDLALHTGFVIDPTLGLIAVSEAGTEQITPQGPKLDEQATGRSAALLPAPGAGLVLLMANGDLQAYPATFDNPDPDRLATDETVDAGSVMTADLGAGVQAVATGDDPVAYQAITAAAGVRAHADLETFQHKMALESVGTGGRPAAQRVPSPAPLAPASTAAPAKSAPAVEPSRSGIARPQVKVLASSAAAPPYDPATMRSYLGLHGDGTGQTIAIVDAYHDPNIVADAEHFSEQFGLPGVCGAGGDAQNCFTLDLSGSSPSSDEGWSLETSLDVEWAHAVAPRARILLVQATDASFAALFHAVDLAAATHPAAVSMSWGVGFEFSDETYYDAHCAGAHTTCVVSSGDDGYPGDYPADNPAVLAIGGTTLSLNDDGTVADEQAWAGSGGGRSWVESAPSAQRPILPTSAREIPDVSFDADPQTGVGVYDSYGYQGQSGWFQVGGTSLGAPAWSALLADTDQLRAAAGSGPLTGAGVQRAVYGLPSGPLADITSGPPIGLCPTGCSAGTGFDAVTGLGSPRSGIDTALAGAMK